MVRTKNPVVAALIIGRGNNTLTDKNVRLVHGRPLLQWPALAAKHSKYVSRFYISSDDDKILLAGEEVGFAPIRRPDELSTPTAQSTDAVTHACTLIEATAPVDILIVMHANVGTISSRMIDDCVEMMVARPELSSVIPSHYKDEYHPYRAKMVTGDGTLSLVIDPKDKKISANRQDLDECVFFDHSFWVLDVKRGVWSEDGQPPWPCMGKTIAPYITQGCFDVHDLNDLVRTENWIVENKILDQYS